MDIGVSMKKTGTKEICRIKKYGKLEKINNNNFYIPNYADHNKFINKNYRTDFLKQICRHYKLKLSGNKPILVDRIYNFLLLSNSVIIIQKYTLTYLRKTYNKLLGPAIFNRKLCKNDVDFFTLEDILKLPYRNFISLVMDDNVWGFNILSLYNLFIKNTDNVLNPYTREKLGYDIFNRIKRVIKLSKMFNEPVNVLLNNNNDITTQKKIELRCLEIFQYIDQLGNYTKSNWFMSLNKFEIIKFIRELIDIWEYRAQLTDEVKNEICHPHGKPFTQYINIKYPHNLGLQCLQKIALTIIEQFVKNGINRESNILGASFILCALTLVNEEAADSLPWLYQSVA